MRLPARNSSYPNRVAFGIYVARRLRIAGHTDLEAIVRTNTLGVFSMGRAWEEASLPVHEAFADRDAADEVLDSYAQEIRAKLGGRGIDAIRQAPFTLIFPDKTVYYTSAPLDEEVKRYQELRERLIEHLTVGDVVRGEYASRLDAGIAAYGAVEMALEFALGEEMKARSRLEAAQDGWTAMMEQTYGTLVARFGSRATDRFYPRLRTRLSGD